jgi:hypothetical protein
MGMTVVGVAVPVAGGSGGRSVSGISGVSVPGVSPPAAGASLPSCTGDMIGFCAICVSGDRCVTSRLMMMPGE